ncbi:MAG: MFS transporter, partial [Candidatus Hodarchaeales archaeon]
METNRAKNIYYLMGILAPSTADSFLVGFYTIYLLRYLTLTEIGIQYAFWLLILALADFPTGTLADFWGARNCMILSYGLMVCGYAGLLLVDSLFTLLLPLFFAIHFFFAASAAQESGTLVAWFTNQWKANKEDMATIREIFGKANAYSIIAGTSTSIIGGFLAAYLTINLVFIGALAYCGLGALATTHLIRSIGEQEHASRSYFAHTKKALSVLSEERRLYLLIGIGCLNYAGWFVVTYLVIQPFLYQDLEAWTLKLSANMTLNFEPLFVVVLLVSAFSTAAVLGYHFGGRIQRYRDASAAVVLFFPLPCIYLLLFGSQIVFPQAAFPLTVLGILLISLTTGLYNPH